MERNLYFKLDNYIFFSIEITSLKIIPPSPEFLHDKKKLYLTFKEKYYHFVNTLLKQKDNVTYEIRFVNNKADKNSYQLKIYFLVKFQNDDVNEAKKVFNSLINSFTNYFPEYKYNILSQSDLEKLIQQSINYNYVSSINRRVVVDQLDTLKSSIKEFGFIKQENTSSSLKSIQSFTEAENTVIYIYPFNYQSLDTEEFFNYFYLINRPLILSIKLRPTEILSEEEDFFERQITKCEKFAQLHIESGLKDLSQISPTLQTLSRSYQKNLIELFENLKVACGLLTIEILTQDKPDFVLLNTIANYFSSSPKKELTENVNFLSGGYDLIIEETNKDSLEKILRMELQLKENTILSENFRLRYLFDPNEASSVFRFPFPTFDILPNFKTFLIEERYAPVEFNKSGCFIGFNTFYGNKKEIFITDEDRKRHIYIIGQTGTGKTTLLKTMILSDIEGGKGVCVIDPHGDLYREILGKIPEHRINDMVLFDPTDKNYPVGFNFLDCKNQEEKYFIVQEFIGIIKRLLEAEYGTNYAEYTGPVFFLHTRNNLLLTMSDPSYIGTLFDFYNIFTTKNYWKKWQAAPIKDPVLKNWVENVLPKTDYLESNNGLSLGDYISSKFHNFIFDPLLRNILAPQKSTINFSEIMNNNKILLINLAKGELTEENSRFLGMLIMTKIMTAAMERIKIPVNERKDFFVYVDEFQNIAINSFTTLVSEARKFGVYLTMANQFIKQIMDEKITLSLFGNVGTLISFRIGQEDAKILEDRFFPHLTKFHLTNLPNWVAYVSTLVNGQSIPPFNIETVIDDKEYSHEVVDRIIKQSREKYSTKASEIKFE